METVYDWVTVGIFAGLIVLFLQRSVGPERDSLWQYLAASVALAVLNQVGNAAVKDGNILYHLLAGGGILAVAAFIHFVLKPFGNFRD
ncbi:MAG: XrtV sorting system accessory protein [Sphingomonadaceae bacterium]